MNADNKTIVLPNAEGSSSIHSFKTSGTYTWTIYNFGFALENDCDYTCPFSSHIFSFGNGDELDWELQLHPSVSADKAKEHMTLKIVYYNGNDYDKVQAECKVSILGKNVVHTVKTDSFHTFTNGDWKKDDFIKIDYLMNEENGLLIKNKLVIFCEIDVIGYYEVKEEDCVEHEIFMSKLRVSEDLQLLMNNNSYDIVLTLNNEKYYVHKCILASRSPVFSAMFEHSMQEERNGEVALTDISGETLKKLIHFIYTGVIINVHDISKETLAELLVTADKYEINDLKEFCEMLLYNILNISNAIEMLIFADFHNAEKLKYAVAHFMVANVKEFNKTPEFESFSKSYAHLLPKLIEVSEGSVFESVNRYDENEFNDLSNFSLHELTLKKNTWSVTHLKTDKETYTWKINNFSHFIENKFQDKAIISNKFGNNKEYSWQLFLYPRGVNNETKDYVSLYIRLLSEKKTKEIKARYKFYIIDSKGQKKNKFESDTLIFISYGERLGQEKFVERECLSQNKDNLVPNDTLTILCKVVSSKSCQTDAVSLGHMYCSIPKYQFGMSQNQIKLFKSEKFCDLTLVAGNSKFPVHRSILSIRSPAFYYVLNKAELLKEDTVIVIIDMSPAILKNFLLYIYSGNVKHLDVSAKDLYIEARKYNIEHLKVICETYLCINLTLENVCDNFAFAHINIAHKLKSKCLEFIANNLENVFSTSGYTNLANDRPQLLKDIIYKLHINY